MRVHVHAHPGATCAPENRVLYATLEIPWKRGREGRDGKRGDRAEERGRIERTGGSTGEPSGPPLIDYLLGLAPG